MPCSFDDKVIIEKAEFKKFTAGGDIFRVGIISDTQLPPNEKKLEENDLYIRHLRTALTELKNNGVGMILFAGDIGDEASTAQILARSRKAICSWLCRCRIRTTRVRL